MTDADPWPVHEEPGRMARMAHEAVRQSGTLAQWRPGQGRNGNDTGTEHAALPGSVASDPPVPPGEPPLPPDPDGPVPIEEPPAPIPVPPDPRGPPLQA
jgi:hypothetical protein